MAFDGIVTRAMVREINEKIYMGKIEKVYQPEADELVFNIHTKSGNCKLFASAADSSGDSLGFNSTYSEISYKYMVNFACLVIKRKIYIIHNAVFLFICNFFQAFIGFPFSVSAFFIVIAEIIRKKENQQKQDYHT